MRNNKNKSKKKSKLVMFLVISVLLFAFGGILASDLFHVKNIGILGNDVVTDDEIKAIINFHEGESIFTLSSGKSEKILKKNPYIADVDIIKKYPSNVDILIKERICRAYVEYKQMETYILIDEEGMILGTEASPLEDKPVIIGLDFSDYVIGKSLVAENNNSFENVVLLSQLFVKYKMSDVVRVDVNDEKNIKLYVDNVTVKFGSIENADEKIKVIIECMGRPEMENAKGTLDVSSSSDRFIFKAFEWNFFKIYLKCSNGKIWYGN